jgi:hypothetical protein
MKTEKDNSNSDTYGQAHSDEHGETVLQVTPEEALLSLFRGEEVEVSIQQGPWGKLNVDEVTFRDLLTLMRRKDVRFKIKPKKVYEYMWVYADAETNELHGLVSEGDFLTSEEVCDIPGYIDRPLINTKRERK